LVLSTVNECFNDVSQCTSNVLTGSYFNMLILKIRMLHNKACSLVSVMFLYLCFWVEVWTRTPSRALMKDLAAFCLLLILFAFVNSVIYSLYSV